MKTDIVFDRFDEISHIPLRVYNRVVMLNNLMNDSGKLAAEAYVSIFSEAEKKQMYIVNLTIKQKGLDFVRKEVTKGLTLVE